MDRHLPARRLLAFHLLALGLIVAGPAVAQTAATPGGPVDPATTDLNGQVQAQLDAVAAANRQRADDYARQLAAFEEAQARFARAKAANDAEQASAAAARRAYEAALARWTAATAGIAPPPAARRLAATTPAGAGGPRRVCRLEQPTGRLTKTRVCRIVGVPGATDEAEQRGVEDFRAGLQSSVAQGLIPRS